MAAKKKGTRKHAKRTSAPTIEQRLKLLERQHGEVLKLQRLTLEQVAGTLERIGAIEERHSNKATFSFDPFAGDLDEGVLREVSGPGGVIGPTCNTNFDFTGTASEPKPPVPWWQRLFNTFARGAAQAS